MNVLTVAKRKTFWKTLLSLVIPIAIQSFLSNAVNSADVIMIGNCGQTELSAVSLANQYQFLLIGIVFGLNSGITILASQYWGKRDTDAIQIILGIALKIAFVITGTIALGAVIAPKLLMKVYTADEELISVGAQYLRIVGPALLLWGLSEAYLSMLRSIERAARATWISSCALVGNVILNAILIFGMFGFPALGVRGAAIATLIARTVEFLLCVMDAIRGKAFSIQPSLLLKTNRILTGDYFRYAMPALINDLSWTVAFSTYSIILGHMNADVVAANSVAVTVRDLCTVLCYAVGGGACVMVGIRIGENHLEEARYEADLICWLSLVLGILTGGLILLARPLIFRFFPLTSRAQDYLNTMLIISSYYIIGQIMNTLWIGGFFRSGGNTRWGMICDTITMWCVSVPLGFLCAFVFKLPPMTVYFILCLDEFWKIPIVYRHYRSYVWLKNITREEHQ